MGALLSFLEGENLLDLTEKPLGPPSSARSHLILRIQCWGSSLIGPGVHNLILPAILTLKKEGNKVALLSTWTLLLSLGDRSVYTRWRNSHTHTHTFAHASDDLVNLGDPFRSVDREKAMETYVRTDALLLPPHFFKNKRTVMRRQGHWYLLLFDHTPHWFHEWVGKTLIEFCYFAWNNQPNFPFPVSCRSTVLLVHRLFRVWELAVVILSTRSYAHAPFFKFITFTTHAESTWDIKATNNGNKHPWVNELDGFIHEIRKLVHNFECEGASTAQHPWNFQNHVSKLI